MKDSVPFAVPIGDANGVPEGYVLVSICGKCYALIANQYLQEHFDWHYRQDF